MMEYKTWGIAIRLDDVGDEEEEEDMRGVQGTA